MRTLGVEAESEKGAESSRDYDSEFAGGSQGQDPTSLCPKTAGDGVSQSRQRGSKGKAGRPGKLGGAGESLHRNWALGLNLI